MPISQSSSDALFVVLGSTGNLGRSIIDAIAASATAAFRVRAITRDATGSKGKDLVKLGAEIVSADVNDVETLKKAFEGASYVYGLTITDYKEYPHHKNEIKQGHAQIDAAVAAGVETFIWMGLSDHSKLSGGRFPVPTFDVKQRIAEYGRAQKSLTFKCVNPGSFNTNYITNMAPRKNDYGGYSLAIPVKPDTGIPNIDISKDYGRYVLAACKPGSPDTVLAGGPKYQTPVEMCEDFERVSGKKVTFFPMPDDMYIQVLSPQVGQNMAEGLLAMWKGIRETGYYGSASLDESNALLDSPPTHFVETLKSNKAAVDQLFA